MQLSSHCITEYFLVKYWIQYFMSLQSEYLITSELQKNLKNTILLQWVALFLLKPVEYYVSNNYTVYVLLIDTYSSSEMHVQ